MHEAAALRAAGRLGGEPETHTEPAPADLHQSHSSKPPLPSGRPFPLLHTQHCRDPDSWRNNRTVAVQTGPYCRLSELGPSLGGEREGPRVESLTPHDSTVLQLRPPGGPLTRAHHHFRTDLLLLPHITISGSAQQGLQATPLQISGQPERA
ncbi:hypothetical protein NDU88_006117 [Pleurodeles waltl]|uniref:Uncharacterized protein n=1 Tax=Pleurodeles waltl TaxID=8319 RepID=A0AAV7TXD0_PLEWA|nr:hypothetical protein NDU88_006117 [Pleurodeles waltl]